MDFENNIVHVSRRAQFANWINKKKCKILLCLILFVAFCWPMDVLFEQNERFRQAQIIHWNFTKDLHANFLEYVNLNQKQDREIKKLKESFKATEAVLEKFSDTLAQNDKNTDFHIKAASAESCSELRQHGFTKSGYYQVDLDGRYNGSESMELFCAFSDINPDFDKIIISANLNRSIPLNGSSPFVVTPRYNLSLDQIQRVIQHSNCYQEIIFECLNMPLHTKAVKNHAFWLDKNGTERVFPDPEKLHENCDLHSNFWTLDRAKITSNGNFLPITKFGYRLDGLPPKNVKNGSAKITIGDLICKEPCSYGWTHLGSSCYKFPKQSLSFDDAQKLCEDLGGKLAEPRSITANNLLAEHLHYRNAKFMWIGINDKIEENTFVYSSSGEKITFANWSKGRPDNGGNSRYQKEQDCVDVLMNEDFGNTWKWNDWDCQEQLPFSCEKPMIDF